MDFFGFFPVCPCKSASPALAQFFIFLSILSVYCFSHFQYTCFSFSFTVRSNSPRSAPDDSAETVFSPYFTSKRHFRLIIRFLVPIKFSKKQTKEFICRKNRKPPAGHSTCNTVTLLRVWKHPAQPEIRHQRYRGIVSRFPSLCKRIIGNIYISGVFGEVRRAGHVMPHGFIGWKGSFCGYFRRKPAGDRLARGVS